MTSVPRSYTSNVDLVAKYEPLLLSKNTVEVTYVWIDGCEGLRSKSKTIGFEPKSVKEVPAWSFGMDFFYSSELPLGSEVNMLPVAMYNDPFSGGNSKIVLCEGVQYENGFPIESNTRHSCLKTMNLSAAQEPIFLIEQEYCLCDGNERNCYKPLGWPDGGLPNPLGSYYCGVGTRNVVGRDLVEAHFRACMYAGVNIGGESASQVLSRWKFQIGPSQNISLCDDLWMARYLLIRIAEDFHIGVTFDLKLFQSQTIDGSSVNLSTKEMRQRGIVQVEQTIDVLRKNHCAHKLSFGGYPSDLARRCKSDDAMNDYGQVFRSVILDNCLYLQDTRPPSNMDPYVVCKEMLITAGLST